MVQNCLGQLEFLTKLNVEGFDLSPLFSEASLKIHFSVVLAKYIAEVEKVAQVSTQI